MILSKKGRAIRTSFFLIVCTESFGLFYDGDILPVFMDSFKESREKAGTYGLLG